MLVVRAQSIQSTVDRRGHENDWNNSIGARHIVLHSRSRKLESCLGKPARLIEADKATLKGERKLSNPKLALKPVTIVFLLIRKEEISSNKYHAVWTLEMKSGKQTWKCLLFCSSPNFFTGWKDVIGAYWKLQ